MTTKYPAVMEQADFRGFGVWFPDFPGCVSQGDEPLAAALSARKALTLHIQGMADMGETIPPPTPAEAVDLPQDVLSYVFLVETEAPAATASIRRTRLAGRVTFRRT